LAMTLNEIKRTLRQDAVARRRIAHAAGGPAAAVRLAEDFGRFVTAPPGAIVSGYWPAGSEIDIRPLLGALHGAGHRLVLPVVVERDAPLIFRAWRPGEPVIKGNGAWVPDETAPRFEPDLLLVPLVGFDRRGGRLGQGAGYYDRTLLKLRGERAVTAIGIAYAVQEISEIPTGPYDQPLDAVLTEAGLIEIG
jgi:5-formyltetrahydrofolate cyclo-ligase